MNGNYLPIIRWIFRTWSGTGMVLSHGASDHVTLSATLWNAPFPGAFPCFKIFLYQEIQGLISRLLFRSLVSITDCCHYSYCHYCCDYTFKFLQLEELPSFSENSYHVCLHNYFLCNCGYPTQHIQLTQNYVDSPVNSCLISCRPWYTGQSPPNFCTDPPNSSEPHDTPIVVLTHRHTLTPLQNLADINCSLKKYTRIYLSCLCYSTITSGTLGCICTSLNKQIHTHIKPKSTCCKLLPQKRHLHAFRPITYLHIAPTFYTLTLHKNILPKISLKKLIVHFITNH